MKSEIKAKIEYQEVIGEANPGGYQPVRFSRVNIKPALPHIQTYGDFKEAMMKKVKKNSIQQKQVFVFLNGNSKESLKNIP